LECLLHGSTMAVEIGEVVIDGGVFGIQGERLLPLLLRGVLLLEVAQKTAKSDARAGVVGMAGDEILVGLANRSEALANAPLQIGGRDAPPLGPRPRVVLGPLVHIRRAHGRTPV